MSLLRSRGKRQCEGVIGRLMPEIRCGEGGIDLSCEMVARLEMYQKGGRYMRSNDARSKTGLRRRRRKDLKGVNCGRLLNLGLVDEYCRHLAFGTRFRSSFLAKGLGLGV